MSDATTLRLRLPILFALLLAACGRSAAEEAAAAVAAQRPAVEARLAALKRLAPEMRAVPRLAADTLTLQGIRLQCGPARSFEPVNAGILYEEDLADLDSPHTTEPWPMAASDVFRSAVAVLKDTGFVAAHERARVLTNGSSARYAVMVRTLERVVPKVDEATRTFTKGVQAGEAHVFDLDTGTHLGGFRFAATNDDHVRVYGTSDLADVKKELSIHVELAIEKGLAKSTRP